VKKIGPYIGIALAVGAGVRIAPFIEYYLVSAFIVWIVWRRVMDTVPEPEYTIEP